jgi:hypothetical protein
VTESIAPLTLPADASGWHDWLAGRVDGHLATAQEILDRLKDGTAQRNVGVVPEREDLVGGPRPTGRQGAHRA